MNEKLCRKCNVTKNLAFFSKERRSSDGVRSQCKECISKDMAIYTKKTKNEKSLYDAAYRLQNKEKLVKYSIEYRIANKEKLIKYRAENKLQRSIKFAEYALKNAGILKQKRINKYASNPDKYRAISAQYRKLNPEKIAKYKQDNKLEILAYWHVRRSRKILAGGRYSAKDIRNMLVMQKGKCPICITAIKNKYHIDHVLPLAKGGSNHITNIQLLCPPCNLKKSAKDPIDFMQSQGFLL